MNQEIICINSTYSKEHLEFFALHNVVYPLEGKVYNLRYKKRHSHGEWGLTVQEIINPEVPIGFYGNLYQEQTFHINRFTDLLGNPLKEKEEEIELVEQQEVKINTFYDNNNKRNRS